MLAPGFQDWSILSANDINDYQIDEPGYAIAAAQIVGVGQLDGQTYAVLLTPIPEPSTMALVSVGAIGVAAAGRRRQRRRTSFKRRYT